MKRRTFVKMSSAALIANFLPLYKSIGTEAIYPPPIVWEIDGSGVNEVRTLFAALGGLEKFISKDITQATVLIKPNLCLPHPAEMGTTTSPHLVDALCLYLLTAGVKRIIIADHTLKDAGKFKNSDMLKLGEKYPRVKCMLANEQRHYRPMEVGGKVLKTTEVLKILYRADLFINLATAKHHSATQVSLATKNLMGLIWDRTEFHTRLYLPQAIADLATVIRPQINIIDATRVLLNGGPTGPGPVIKENRLFASTDMLALDAVVVSRYSFGGRMLSAKEVPHLVAAHQNGVGEIDLKKIVIQKV